jgi:hypothetical protein
VRVRRVCTLKLNPGPAKGREPSLCRLSHRTSSGRLRSWGCTSDPFRTMSDWLNELPFAWVLVVALALFYIAATAIYTRVMILVTDRSDDAFAKREKQQTRVEPPKSVITRPTPVSPILRAHDGEVAAVAWDRVTSGEIELMKRLLVTYRAELLAHHAEELSALDEQQAEVEALERSICAFAEKYKTERGDETAA